MNRRIANAMYIAALTQNDETLELIERRFGKDESRIKICRELYISDRTYYRRLKNQHGNNGKHFQPKMIKF